MPNSFYVQGNELASDPEEIGKYPGIRRYQSLINFF